MKKFSIRASYVSLKSLTQLTISAILCTSLLFIQPSQAEIFESLPASGSIDVTLHPGETTNTGQSTVVAFGVPFPRNLINNIDQIRVTDAAGNDIASDVRETMRWRSVLNDPQVNGVRSVVIFLETTFANLQAKQIRVVYGQGSGTDWTGPSSVRDTWVSTELGEDDVYPNDEGLFEPAVYATLPPSWMAASIIRTPFVPKENVSPEFQWHISAMENFGETSVNEVGEAVESGQIVPVSILQRGPWLFDRAGVYWDSYYKTGELYWLRAAHKASQFYAGRINDSGIFELAGWEDPKYSFSGGLIGDLIMTGDTNLETVILRIARFHQEDHNYFLNSIGRTDWNERWYTYWLLGALSAFELTGEERFRTAAIERAEHLYTRAQFPIAGWNAEGGILHSKVQHDGGGGALYQQEPVISPWMSALLADAVWRYYIHSEDSAALAFLADLADSVVDHALYISRLDGVDYVVPHYLSSGQINPSVYTVSGFGDRFTDSEHALDVAGLIARGYWAKQKLGQTDTASLLNAIEDLKPSIDYTFSKWTRPRGTPPQPKHVLRPARSFNWWFGTTSDLEWLLTDTPGDTTPPPTPDPIVAPNGLQASITADQTVSLTWNDRADNETAYLLERSTNNASFVQLATLAANSSAYSDGDVVVGTSYAYRVRARTDGGVLSLYSNSVEVTLEGDGGGDDDDGGKEDLAVPTQLAVTSLASNQIGLSWIDNSISETHVEIQRSVNDGAFRWHNRLGANTTSYVDNSVLPNTKYSYRVRAIIFQVETSDYSTPVSATTPASGGGETRPNAPSGLTASAVTSSSAELTWRDNADDETSMVIERSLNGQSYTVLAELPAGTTSYTDQSLAADTTYYYRVQAKKGQLTSDYSNVVQLTSANVLLPLATPTGLAAVASRAGSISLTWNDVSSAETHFELQRSVNGGAFRWLERISANTTSFTDRNVSPGVTYAYRIRAIDFQVATTDYSAPVSVVAEESQSSAMSALNLLLLADN